MTGFTSVMTRNWHDVQGIARSVNSGTQGVERMMQDTAIIWQTDLPSQEQVILALTALEHLWIPLHNVYSLILANRFTDASLSRRAAAFRSASPWCSPADQYLIITPTLQTSSARRRLRYNALDTTLSIIQRHRPMYMILKIFVLRLNPTCSRQILISVISTIVIAERPSCMSYGTTNVLHSFFCVMFSYSWHAATWTSVVLFCASPLTGRVIRRSFCVHWVQPLRPLMRLLK